MIEDGLRVLVVAQRYGTEVVGGSESHARLVAERLARRHRVEVATTTALDYWTWAPHYRAGVDEVDGVRVRRFAVRAGRAADFKAFERKVMVEEHSLSDELAWLRVQGPDVPGLYEFLHREGSRYDAIVFYTYIYAPTALGLPLVPERAALVPTAHEEGPLRLAPYRALFHLPRAIGFLTPEERDLVHATFRNEQVPHEILGIGLAPPPPHDPAAFRARRGLGGRLLLYLGQVVEAKSCDELVADWCRLRDAGGVPDATLVLAGEVRMPLPARADVQVLGRVSEAEKFAALSAAEALVQPSRFESLGIVLLEAAQVGTPVLVHEGNAVTRGFVARSGAGLAYASREEFAAAATTLLGERRARGAAGRAYVERECSFDAFDARLERLLALAACDA